ncbi:EAL domain-containing protein [Uliginosibacterium sp. 31-16]|uniref:GGDEF/EAL domain-containing response regulator n=1 Tax=Uliginosibacterium sp. 31-16 TaxID=3068315 RepID=UPI0027400A48|nr:EAL domain-containing protein [Uliginosibacterium sp. 31-16]MDP5239371.1 EAL domain-containing protein [Uliginosibacterium sp. 31-16]
MTAQHDLQLDEPFLFAEEGPAHPDDAASVLHWRCLIVDDDEGVHQSMVFAMNNLMVEGGRIEWLHAYSAREARELLARERDVALIVLDVVMEHEQAGLDLVRAIRVDLGLADTRIILHTGQPGFAPEIAAIRDYDINDYRTKSELTRNHIYTCLASAIRTYRQIRSIEASRQQLRRIIQAGNVLMSQADEATFAQGALELFSGLLQIESSGLTLLHHPGSSIAELQVVSASGEWRARTGQALTSLGEDIRNCCLRSLESRQAEWGATGVALSIPGRDGGMLVLYLDALPQARRLVDDSVLEIFVAHFSACLNNRLLLGRLHHDAFFDRLLGLPNRRCLNELVEAHYADGTQAQMTLALIDIDRFGEINEALGQTFGDALLQAMAGRLEASVQRKAMLARLSADIFAVFGPSDWVTPEQLLPLFATPLSVLDQETMVSVTIGLTRLVEVEASDGAAALEAAFQALRTAKTTQRGQLAWYSPDLSRQTHERVNLLNGLRMALRSAGLFVVYQPQIALGDRRLIGLEALVRWRTESGEPIGPDRFIPVAEQSGLIREIGFFVLREACGVLASLHREGDARLRMAVNVSAIQFRHPAFLQELKCIIADSGIDARCLELEITESIAMEDTVYVRETLDALHAMGIQLAIDDFGTGYSSLAQLKGLAVDRLKIDKAFVRDLNEADADASIAGVVIQLGRRLGKEVIAEGVETEDQAMLLGRMGCPEAQGYLFGRPMPLDELRAWIGRQPA